MRTKGIDISRAQEKFDFTAAVSAGVKFVIIRAAPTAPAMLSMIICILLIFPLLCFDFFTFWSSPDLTTRSSGNEEV